MCSALWIAFGNGGEPSQQRNEEEPAEQEDEEDEEDGRLVCCLPVPDRDRPGWPAELTSPESDKDSGCYSEEQDWRSGGGSPDFAAASTGSQFERRVWKRRNGWYRVREPGLPTTAPCSFRREPGGGETSTTSTEIFL